MKGNLLNTVRNVVHLSRSRDLSLLAGGIAFFAFLSLLPAMVLLLAFGTLVGGEQFATSVVTLVGTYLSDEGGQILSEALGDTTGLASISAVSAVFLLWSALKVFRAIDIAFDRVYQATSETSLLEQLRDGLVVSSVISLGLGVLLGVQILLTHLGFITMRTLLGVPLSIVSIFLLFWPLYYFLPPKSQPFRTILPGTVASIVGFLLLRQLFELYATQAGQYEAYGLVGAVLLFLLWLYFGSLILVFGAVINASLARTDFQRRDLQRDEPTTESDD